jgi:hypothetical protein
MRKYVLLTSILLLAILASVSIANADSAYSVTNNYHGKDTPLGATVVVTATTTDSNVVSVIFIWHDATGAEQWRTEPVNVVWTEGVGVAQCQGSPNSLGDWGVQAYFVGTSGGHSDHDIAHILGQKGTSFLVVTDNVVPEVPILGTAGIAGAMALGWVVKAKRKNGAL